MYRRLFFRKWLCCALVVLLMTGIGARGFNSGWLSHDLEHWGSVDLAQSIDHWHEQTSANSGKQVQQDQEDPLSDVAHHLLHAANHFELSPPPTLSALPALGAGIAASWFTRHAVPRSKPERTFRPPRNALSA